MNYTTGIYENQIPGAVASGDLGGSDEWILVPFGTNVTYAVSSYPTEQFLKAYPQFQQQFQEQSFNVTYLSFDQTGNRSDLGFQTLSISPNSTVLLQQSIPEFNPAVILPIFFATTLLGVMVYTRKRLKQRQ